MPSAECKTTSGSAIQLPSAALAAGLLLAVAVFLRAWKLENIPGVNGDEAWSGVQAWNWAHGQPMEWRTPTGNLLNVFFLGPLALLHLWWPPSFVVLRLVAVASGLAALGLNWWLCRRTFDLATAAVSTTALAVLPIAIAYSRFAWDACQTPAASVLVLYAGLSIVQCRRWRCRAALAGSALAAAAIVHPTNLFLAPLVMIPLAWRIAHERSDRSNAARLRPSRWPLAVAGGGLVVAVLVMAVRVVPAAWAAWNQPLVARLTAGLHRAFDLREHLAFAVNFGRLFSGETVYRYLSGAIVHQPGTLPTWRDVGLLDLVTWTLLGLCLVGGWRACRAVGGAIDRCLAVAWLLLVVGFYLVAGPEAIAPHFERYGICLVAPTVLVAARGIGWWLQRAGRAPAAAHGLLLALAAALLCGFFGQYFRFIERTGGRSHVAFRTGSIEPKLAAWQTIARRSSGTATVVADCWWTYWPLAYLTADVTQVRVLLRGSDGSNAAGSNWPHASTSGEVWQVACAEWDGGAAGSGRPSSTADAWERICDFSGSVALIVERRPTELPHKN